MTQPMPAESDRLNPYGTFLGGADPLEIIRATPGKLERLAGGASDQALTRSPCDRKWSVRDIVCHLADTELVFGFRLRQTVAQPSHVIQPFDQDEWAKPVSSFTTRDGLDAFAAFRQWNLLFIDAVGSEAYSKRVTHPERGDMTFRHLLETMGGHDINHLRQVERLLSP
jgi:hypothetical protein